MAVNDQPTHNLLIENEGFGRFEYSNGTVYEGHWMLLNNHKVKHGEGVLLHAGATSHEKGNEEYSGNWVNDKMEGYGVYKYTSGAIYSGEWRNGKQHGKVFLINFIYFFMIFLFLTKNLIGNLRVSRRMHL
jgi:hypothetical protein